MTQDNPPPPPAYTPEDPTNAAHLVGHVAQAIDANVPDTPPQVRVEGQTEQGYPDEKSQYSRYSAQEESMRNDVRASRILGSDSNDPSQTRLNAADSDPADLAVPPPAYSETLGEIKGGDANLGTKAKITEDGRVSINIDQRTNRLSQILVPALRQQLDLQKQETPLPSPYIPTSLGGSPGELPPPPLNVVIHVVGSRGDVQPFVALGKVLKETYRHRVRLATHPVFKKFVEENGLEFFSIGGDPAELMAFMVKNPGLMPGFDVLRSGDIGKRRRGIEEMIKGCWRSCIEPGDGSGAEASSDDVPDWRRDGEPLRPEERPFVADAIIANPPSFAHVHIAEKMGIPLHMMFTMPWSATQAFPHPLANIESSNADPNITNYLTYALVDMLTWQGLGDVINRFRVRSLSLEPISLLWAPGLLDRLKIPYTYCWSPALIPKPKDWRQHISISGFYFLNLATNYRPEPDLDAFMRAGPPPVYIGFGSIVVDDPNALTNMIFEAVKKTGQRALVSKGWGGFGGDDLNVPEGVFMLGNVPHDWLFQHVSCVVHHGGAGTTAAGIAAGRPTCIVPFFGDQPFWGAMVHKAGAGPAPIHHKELTADKLAAAITEALKPATLQKAREMREKISQERGSDTGAQRFHQMLNIDSMRCCLVPEHAAVWRVKRTQIRLSALAAYILAEKQVISFSDLKLFRQKEYDTETGPPDFITGGAGALTGTISTMMMGIADLPVATLKAMKIHPDAAKKKKAAQEAEAEAGPSNSGESAMAGALGSSGNASQVSLGSGKDSGASTPRGEKSNSNLSPDNAEGTRSRSPSQSLAPSASSSERPTTPDARERASSQSAYSPSSTNPSSIVDTAMATGKGFSRILGAGFKSPMDFTLAISKGFHNTPKLFGEEVRQVGKVTDFQSGLRTAGKEFGLGLFEGVTDLVTKPLAGAKKEGVGGFIKGVGKGVLSISTKPSAGFMAIPAYTMKGVYAEIQKNFSNSIDGYIIAARTAQGWEDYQKTGPEDHKEIVQRYLALLKDVKAKGKKDEAACNAFIEKRKAVRRERYAKVKAEGGSIASYASTTSNTSTAAPVQSASTSGYGSNAGSVSQQDQRPRPPSYHYSGLSEKQLLEVQSQLDSQSQRGYAVQDRHQESSDDDFDHPLAPLSPTSANISRTAAPNSSAGSTIAPGSSISQQTSLGVMPTSSQTPSQAPNQPSNQTDADLMEAIKRSVAESSQGDTTDDEMIAAAVRASIAELRKQRERWNTLPAPPTSPPLPGENYRDTTSAPKAPEHSLSESSLYNDSTAGTPRASERSIPAPEGNYFNATSQPPPIPASNTGSQAPLTRESHALFDMQREDGDDEDMRRAIEESQKMHEEMEKDRREEEIVMEYVKKASMAERGFGAKEKR